MVSTSVELTGPATRQKVLEVKSKLQQQVEQTEQ